MRAMPFLHFRGKMSAQQHVTLIFVSFRCNAISRVAGSLPTRGIETAASFAADDASTSASASFSASFSASNASNAAASAASAASAAASAVSAASAASASASTAASFSASASSSASGFWEQLRLEAAKLEAGMPVNVLIASRLWEKEPEFWQSEYLLYGRLLGKDEMASQGFGVWREWYDSVYTGKPVFGIRNQELRQTLERNIALGSINGKFNAEFWNRDPAKFNADIKRWVLETQAEDERLSRIEDSDSTGSFTEKDFRSRPASIQTTVRDGKVDLERHDPLTDLPKKTAEAAAADLAKGLRDIAAEAQASQADPRTVDFMRQAAETISQAVNDQEMLFESGRNQKTLEGYSGTVDAEWGGMLAPKYHALIAQFAQTLNHFETWRSFAMQPASLEERATPTEVAANVETVVDALSAHKAAFSEIVLQRLRSLTTRFQLAINRQQADDPSHSVWPNTAELLQSDLVTSLSNVLLTYAQNGLLHYGVKCAEGVAYALDKAAIGIGVLAVTAALGGALIFLEKKYPAVYATAKKAIKKLLALAKETEPDNIGS